MLEAIATLQDTYLQAQSSETKKKLGQFFTDDVTANYMASLIHPIEAPTIRILDAGSGAGILTVSAALQCLKQGNRHVHAVLYEIDKSVLLLLEENMKKLEQSFSNKGGTFSYVIHNEDFVLARHDKKGSYFHLSIINPPYFKYNSKTSPYAGVTNDLYKGNPNIYASFMAVVSACMLPHGQMIAIVPRSFTNGLYFKGFRKYLNNTMNLCQVHIFKSRNKVFNKQSVLQENIICHYKREEQQPAVSIYTSEGQHDLAQREVVTYASKLIIDMSNEHEIIRIPEKKSYGSILEQAQKWQGGFQKNGYFISTGPVVEHRTRQFITLPDTQEASIPLIRMHNIKNLGVDWQSSNPKNARFRLQGDYKKHTVLSGNYVIVKRFSSKDEKRRLVAGLYRKSQQPQTYIALENHLNYIGHNNEELSLAEAYGLTALLNSTLMDQYFRCISGNTQVNATEVRLMRLPTRDTITKIGVEILELPTLEQVKIDNIIYQYLNLPA